MEIPMTMGRYLSTEMTKVFYNLAAAISNLGDSERVFGVACSITSETLQRVMNELGETDLMETELHNIIYEDASDRYGIFGRDEFV